MEVLSIANSKIGVEFNSGNDDQKQSKSAQDRHKSTITHFYNQGTIQAKDTGVIFSNTTLTNYRSD
ncbi:hypothetical protein GC017_07475 [Campylobacter hepaticus]|uniref:hypothetical protein n=1 Tax=Campylobacter bilis TaxID=2691918 RepID=UPI00130EA837|nr:hypothetical protein [Campylobacter bilis]MBM0637803.1 hypothetical protein [Campylobacter bilis]MPV64294.1 hypothetical protein [Campylobacter hepaticus]